MFVVFGAVGMFGYYYKTLGLLYEHGLDSSIKILPSEQFAQIKKYREISIKNNLPMGWPNFMTIYPYACIILLAGWWLLVQYL